MRTPRSWTAMLAGSASVLALGLGLTPVTQANAAPDRDRPASGSPGGISDDMVEGDHADRRRPGPVDRTESRPALKRARADSPTAAKVGDARTWLADDSVQGPYLKRYVLKGVGPHVQVWLSNDRSFPVDDCRNDLGLTEVTQEQIDSFVAEFSDNMYPKESKVFSTPPARNGRNSYAADLGLPADYFAVPKSQADDIVVLVDNVRDENFYEPDTPDGQTYTAGFFWSYFNELADRNIMTVDAFDWLHRTGANPPDDSTDPAYGDCAEELGRERDYFRDRARDYEGVFAHEYQHLLEYYEDPDEGNWINEGVSDWAQTLTGYVDPTIDVARPDADGHMSCFAGFSGKRFGGPANSLTQWGDQGGPEILCDYGAAYSLMEYLESHWGTAIMTRLHRMNSNGLDNLDSALDAVGAKPSAIQVLERWAAAVAIDRALDRNGGDLRGGGAGAFSARTLSFHLAWGNPQSWNDEGVPGNSSDYVRLRDENGDWLSADQIDTIAFDGDDEAAPYDVEWTEDQTPPDDIPAQAPADDTEGCYDDPPAPGAGGAALYSGCGDDLDRSIAREVSIPADPADATLSFETLYDIENEWDFGVIQVSDDGGETWDSLQTEDTTSRHQTGEPGIIANLPGLTGSSGGWQTQTADLSAWAGQDVLLAFRYLTDEAWTETGWWVRDITVGNVPVPASLAGWQTQTQINAPDVTWVVQLVAYGAPGDPVWRHRMRLDRGFDGRLLGAGLRSAIGDDATTVAAVVTRLDRTELQDTPSYYSLKVNGESQPGSRPSS